MERKRIVIASVFSGMDTFLFPMVRMGMIPFYACEKNVDAALLNAANYKDEEGNPLIEFVEITEEEYKYRKKHKDARGRKDLEDTTTIINGKYIRPKTIEEIDGSEIRKRILKKYGPNIVIWFLGGVPCQDLSGLNSKRDFGEESRTNLLLEYGRVLQGLEADIAILEESDLLLSAKGRPFLDKLLKQIDTMPYRVAYQIINALHHGGYQSRERFVMGMVHDKYKVDFIFPQADTVNVKRVKDIPGLDVDYFFSGHYTDSIKGRDHFMCTVTSGSPLWFYKGDKAWHPTIDELLLLMGVEKGEYIIPPGIPVSQIKQAIGNAVCVQLAEALARTILDKILRLRPDGEGYWVPLDETE